MGKDVFSYELYAVDYLEIGFIGEHLLKAFGTTGGVAQDGESAIVGRSSYSR
jgi:hypothetical protein